MTSAFQPHSLLDPFPGQSSGTFPSSLSIDNKALYRSETFNPNYDTPLFLPPSDTISSLAWSPNQQVLAATSWSKDIRMWLVANSECGEIEPCYVFSFPRPMLTSTFLTPDSLIVGGLGCTAKLIQIESRTYRDVLHCMAPVAHVNAVDPNVFVSASWDKKGKLKDLRQPAPISVDNHVVFHFSDIPHATSQAGHLYSVATADRLITTWDWRHMQNPYHKTSSHLELQTRSLTLLPNAMGMVASSVEGKFSVIYFQQHTTQQPDSSPWFRTTSNPPKPTPGYSPSWFESMQTTGGGGVTGITGITGAVTTTAANGKPKPKGLASFGRRKDKTASSLSAPAISHANSSAVMKPSPYRNYTYPAHRMGQDIYSINQVLWHHKYNCLVSLGSDGTYCFWDLLSQEKVWESDRHLRGDGRCVPLTCGSISPDGNILAYATGNDYSTGGKVDNVPTQILLHFIDESDMLLEKPVV